jgi:hypothetical protein
MKMTAKTKKPSRPTRAFLETAKDMHSVGVLSDADYSEITMRHLGKDLTRKIEPVPPSRNPARA